MSARRHSLPVLLAEPRPIPAQQLATSPDLIRNHPARVLIVASRPVPWRHLLALVLKFVRSLLPDRTIARSLVPMTFAMPFAASCRYEVRAASMVHPNPTLVGSPRITFLASRPAPLLHQLHAALRVHLAVIPSAIVRSAVKRLRWTAAVSPRMLRPLVRLCHKLCPASMVHPDPALVETPRDALVARRFAMLPDQVHIPARVCLAIVPPAVIRRTPHNRFGSPILPRPLIFHSEVSPTSVVHPNPSLVIPPRISLLASCPAGLLLQRHTCVRVCRAVPPPSVIRGAGDLSAAAVLAHCRFGEGAYQCAQHKEHSQNSHVDLRNSRQLETSVFANLPRVPANLNPFVVDVYPRMHAPIPHLARPGREAHPAASYNFFRRDSWLTESLWSAISRQFPGNLRLDSLFECGCETVAFADHPSTRKSDLEISLESPKTEASRLHSKRDLRHSKML